MIGRLVPYAIFAALILVAAPARAQFSGPATSVTSGSSCTGAPANGSATFFIFPDANGHILQCNGSTWTTVSAAATAAGLTGYVQYNNGGALAGSANLFWNNSSGYLGIGTTGPVNELTLGNGGLQIDGGYTPQSGVPALYFGYGGGIGTIVSYEPGCCGEQLTLSGSPVTFTDGTTGAEIARFTSSGGLGIGTTSLVAGGGLTIAPAAATSGTPSLLTITGHADATLTASTEATDVNLNLARTVQFATGAIATQRAMRIQAPTYAFVGASTITNAATLDISGPPVAGTNATITNPAALVVESGNVGIGTTSPTNFGSGAPGAILNISSTNTSGASEEYITSGATASGTYISTLGFGTTGNSGSEHRAVLIASKLTASSTTNITSDLELWTNNAGSLSQNVTILPGGNVGIGTAGPWESFQVRPAANYNVGFRNSGTNLTMDVVNDANSANEPLEIRASQTVFDAGNVGIGTASPKSALHVSGGEVQVGSSGASCTSSNAGAIRYASGALSYCTGANWLALSVTPLVTVLTSGTSWTVPSDWSSSNNKIEVIGGGGGSGAGAGGNGCGGGGGGGAYAAVTNLTLTPGASVAYSVGTGGTAGSIGGSGGAGGATYFNGTAGTGNNSVQAGGGGAGIFEGAGGAGGTVVNGTGHAGGGGGAGNGINDGPGGGGAGGPNGTGGTAPRNTSGLPTGGDGGGGSGGGGSGSGGGAGSLHSSGTGGAGGNNSAGVGGGGASTAAGNPGTLGGGGGGGGTTSPYTGGAGGAGADWTATGGGTAGAGGGGGGGAAVSGASMGAGGAGGLYGGGGGASGITSAGNNLAGSAGAAGVIVITYTP
jgi:hypothetical protein